MSNNCDLDETKYLNYAKEYFKKNDVNLLDVGANIGDFTEMFLNIFPDGKSFCFEPIPNVFRTLINRYVLNSNVSIYNFGLHDGKETKKEFYFVKNWIGMSSLHYRPVYFPRFEIEKIEVDLIKLDDFPVKFPKIDYFKIDTEGSELIVLKGARKFINEHQPKFIQFEVGETYMDAGITLKEVWEFLESYNYQIINSDFKNIPATEVSENYSSQNYLAILKE